MKSSDLQMLMIYVRASKRLVGVRTKLRRSMTPAGRQVAACIDDPKLKSTKTARQTADALLGWAKKIQNYYKAEEKLRREYQPGMTYDIRTEDMNPRKDYV